MIGKRKKDDSKGVSWVHGAACKDKDHPNDDRGRGGPEMQVRMSVHDEVWCKQAFYFEGFEGNTFALRISEGLDDDKQPAFSFLSASESPEHEFDHRDEHSTRVFLSRHDLGTQSRSGTRFVCQLSSCFCMPHVRMIWNHCTCTVTTDKLNSFVLYA